MIVGTLLEGYGVGGDRAPQLLSSSSLLRYHVGVNGQGVEVGCWQVVGRTLKG